MSRAAILALLRSLAQGLPPGVDGVQRLLERIAGHEDAPVLRAALVELGAAAVLEGGAA